MTPLLPPVSLAKPEIYIPEMSSAYRDDDNAIIPAQRLPGLPKHCARPIYYEPVYRRQR
jgi:hypothetical protein